MLSLRDEGYLTAPEMADYFRVSLTTMLSALRCRMAAYEVAGNWHPRDFKKVMGCL